MVRVVPDSNVYVSALNFGGVADEVLALGRRHVIALFISASILEEVEGVLLRKFKWSSTRARRAGALIRAFAETVVPRESVAVVTADEADNRILECAAAAKAHLIVTGDHHLRNLGGFRGITILSPREFLDSRVWTAG